MPAGAGSAPQPTAFDHSVSVMTLPGRHRVVVLTTTTTTDVAEYDVRCGYRGFDRPGRPR